jgi:hypothetical protein
VRLVKPGGDAMIDCINIDGVGTAGAAVARALGELSWPDGRRPRIQMRDCARWREKHAQAGLIDWSRVGLPKSAAVAGCLREAGWPADRLTSSKVDVRDLPRGAYRDTITLALTDSHACKHDSVLKALQAGSCAVAVGLGSREAVIECFMPGGPGYCCVHGTDPSWCRRQPCILPPRVSATESAWGTSAETVLTAGRIVADIVMNYLALGDFPGSSGIYLHGGRQDSFSFELDRDCVGPHDSPFAPNGHRVIRLAAGHDTPSLHELLSRVGGDACYADRELAWVWHCGRCGRSAERLHTVHPAAFCEACDARMHASLERASGLTAVELTEFQGSSAALADLGFAEETLIRCLTGSGDLVWVELTRR